MRRECREEIDVEAFVPFEMKISVPDLSMTTFLVTRWRGRPTNTAPDEHDDLAWFTADELTHLHLAHPAGRTQLQAAARRHPS